MLLYLLKAMCPGSIILCEYIDMKNMHLVTYVLNFKNIPFSLHNFWLLAVTDHYCFIYGNNCTFEFFSNIHWKDKSFTCIIKISKWCFLTFIMTSYIYEKYIIQWTIKYQWPLKGIILFVTKSSWKNS